MTSFKKDKSAAVTESPAEVAVVAATPVALAPLEKPVIGTVQGERSRADIKMPELRIVHNVGGLSENFEPGSLVLNGEKVLSQKGQTPVKLTVLNFKRYYSENLPYNPDGPKPRTFETEAEMKAAGLHTEWINDQKPPATVVGDALIAIESDVEDPHFPIEFGGKFYAIALWKLHSSSAFNRAGKTILTAAEWGLKAGLHHGSWLLTTSREKLGKNFVQVPVLKSGPRNSKQLAEFFANVL